MFIYDTLMNSMKKLKSLIVFWIYITRVGAKTLNDKKSEWPKSRNSKLSKFKCRKAGGGPTLHPPSLHEKQ